MPKLEKNRILLVDDEPDFVQSLKVILEKKGYAVITASDGREGLEKARHERPDLIILDVMLPKMNGYEVCQLLKFDEKFWEIPVVMLTARAQDQDKVTGKETGADGYITKPFDPEQLIIKIKEHLGG